MKRSLARARIERAAPSHEARILAGIGRLVGRAFPASRANGRTLGSQVAFACGGLLMGVLLADGIKSAGAAAILCAAGWRWPSVHEARALETRRRAVVAALPDALDLMCACTRAGASVQAAFELAARRDNGPLGAAMLSAVEALDHGLSREAAYRILSETAGVPEVRSMTATLSRAEKLGTSIADTLGELAREMRERRRLAAEEQARGTPIRILFPVIVCFLPAFGLLTVVPVLIVALRSFRSA